MQNKEK